jgi:serine/threonine protein kinase
MVDEYGNVKLLDLGLVAMLEEEMSLVDSFKISGSPAYMPPEALGKRNINVMTTAADVYSLCVMAYEVISAQLPYDVDFLSLNELSEVVNNEKPHPLETPFKEKIPSHIEKIIMRGLNCHPGQRPSAGEIAEIMNSTVRSVGGKSMKIAAVIAVSTIAATIVYYLTVIDGESESQLVISNPTPVAVQEKKPVKAPDSKPYKTTKTFYENSYPAELRSEWEALKNELATDASFKKMGALYYKLPDKCLVKFKLGSAVLRSIDSRFEKAGCLFYDAGKKLTIEIKRNTWDKPKVYCWTPSAGNADMFCPGNKFNK